MPEGLGQLAETIQTIVKTVKGGMGMMLLGIIEDDALLPMLACQGKVSQKEPGAAQRPMGTEEIHRLSDVLGEDKEFFTQFPHSLEFCPY